MFIPVALVTVVSDRDLWPDSTDKNQEQEEHSVVVITDNRN